MKLHIVADQQIPLVHEYFASQFEITLLTSEQIQARQFFSADILLTRSNIKINAALLRDSKIRYVGCPVSGDDHIAKQELDALDIAYFTAPGCNAHSVADYVICSIAYLRQQNFLREKKLRAGVIGVGHVGSLVAKYLEILGFEVLLNDPPKGLFAANFTDLDLICIHTPLTYEGPFPTYHLIEKNFLQQQKKNCIILNAGRGDVIDLEHLKKYGQHLFYCLDVWPNEPNLDLDLMNQCLIATPHIAGYAIQAKWRGTEMLYQNLITHFNLSNNHIEKKIAWPIAPPIIDLSAEKKHTWLDAVLAIYHPKHDHEVMRQALNHSKNRAADFQILRKNYPIRHELSYPLLRPQQYLPKAAKILHNLACCFLEN